MPSVVYNKNIYAPVRRTEASVFFELVPPEAKDRATVHVNNEAPFSRKNQIIDKITHMSAPVATFEPNYWRLDGSFVLPVKPKLSEIEIGWWGEEISDAEGKFTNTPVIEVEFSEVQNIALLGMAFDNAGEEVVEDFEFFAYDGAGTLIYNERVQNNEKTLATTSDGVHNAARIEIKIYKTRNPFRRPRVSELIFGIMIEFGGEDILKLSMVSEADPRAKSLPISELNLTVVNNNRFDQLDEESLAQYLQRRQVFEYNHGLVLPSGRTEWVYGGAYYLDSWTVNDDVVEFTAKGKAEALESLTFYESTFSTGSIGEIIDDVLTPLGFDYAVDEALRNSPPVMRFFGNIDYRKAVTYLAELGVCMVRENRRNGIDFIDISTDEVPTDVIDYDNSFAAPKIKLGTYYNGIILIERAISTKDEQLVNTEINVSGTADIIIYFDKPLYSGTPSCTVSSGFTLSNIKYKAMYMTATVKGNGNAKISATGNSAVFTISKKFYAAPWKDRLEPEYGYIVDLPMMFSNNIAFRDWFLERKFNVLKKRLICDVNWRQNPALDIGDSVNVQANRRNASINMITTSQKIEYNAGVLRGDTKTIGKAVEL